MWRSTVIREIFMCIKSNSPNKNLGNAREATDTVTLKSLRMFQSDRTKGDAARQGQAAEWKNSCPRSKAADSLQFFQLWTAAANSAHSKLAYYNKAAREITTGILSPSSSPSLGLVCMCVSVR